VLVAGKRKNSMIAFTLSNSLAHTLASNTLRTGPQKAVAELPKCRGYHVSRRYGFQLLGSGKATLDGLMQS
jgi:hypothetical protein